jgi:hypothetical protein
MNAQERDIEDLFRNGADSQITCPAESEEAEMRRKLIGVRDTLLVLAFQAVVRATEAMRNLNY